MYVACEIKPILIIATLITAAVECMRRKSKPESIWVLGEEHILTSSTCSAEHYNLVHFNIPYLEQIWLTLVWSITSTILCFVKVDNYDNFLEHSQSELPHLRIRDKDEK